MKGLYTAISPRSYAKTSFALKKQRLSEPKKAVPIGAKKAVPI